jgi:hypothetical protein
MARGGLKEATMKAKRKITAEVCREMHPTPGPRPELFVVISHSPHVLNDWQISSLLSNEASAKDMIRRCDLSRATIVRIPKEQGV